LDDLDKEGKEVFIQKGGKVVVLSKEENGRWAERLRPILDDYVKDMKSKGLPGDEALKFCLDFLKTHRSKSSEAGDAVPFPASKERFSQSPPPP
jgi:TRAP-type transport system periplasmic protein